MATRQGFCAKGTVVAGADLSDSTRGTGDLFKAVDVASGLIAGTSVAAGGLITQTAASGNHVTYTYLGNEFAVAGGAITANAYLQVASSGYLTEAASGDLAIGKNMGPAVSSGEEFPAFVNFITPYNITT